MFNKINETVRSSGMTEQQVFEHWLNDGLITLPQENTPENNSEEDLFNQEDEETTDGLLISVEEIFLKLKLV